MHNKAALKITGVITLICLIFSSLGFTALSASTAMNGAQAIAATAKSQIGYHEGKMSYSKFGNYFGKPNISWCCAFVAWCARNSGIPTNVIPSELSSSSMRKFFKDRKLYKPAPAFGGSYIPKKGDIAFFSDDRSPGSLSHVGIVYSADKNAADCIEGNCSDQVKMVSRKYTKYLVGFATPAYGNTTVKIQEDPVEGRKFLTGKYITEAVMNFRSEPDAGSDETIIAKIPKETVLDVTNISGDWGRTVYDGKTGWLNLSWSRYLPSKMKSEPDKSSDLSAAERVYKTGYYIVEDEMRIRESPNVDCETVGFVAKGSHIAVTQIQNTNWGKIKHHDIEGWLCLNWSKYLKPEIDWLTLDISKYTEPSSIDWARLKDDDKVRSVILRAGGRFGGSSNSRKELYKDIYFAEHYKAAKKAGLHVGVYFFSQAMTTAEAREEAAFTLSILRENNCELDMPVFIDMEELAGCTMYKNASKKTCSDAVDAFCSVIEANGCYAGAYFSRSFAEEHIDPKILKNRAAWIAEWNTDYCSFDNRTDIWQYTDSGKLSSIGQNADLSHCYVNYPKLIADKTKAYKGYQRGDVNTDNAVTAADARLTLRKAVGLERFSDLQITLGDISNDGEIHANDARSIMRLAVGLWLSA